MGNYTDDLAVYLVNFLNCLFRNEDTLNILPIKGVTVNHNIWSQWDSINSVILDYPKVLKSWDFSYFPKHFSYKISVECINCI